MKILFLSDFIPPHHIGGPGKSCWETAQRMRDLGHEIFFITSSQKKELEKEEKRDGIKIFNIYSNYPVYLRDYLSMRNPYTIGKIKNILSQIQPDIVHADGIHWHLSYASLKIAKKFAKAVFLYSRDAMLFNYGKIYIKERECGEINYRASWLKNLKAGRKRFNPLRNILIRRYLKYVDKVFSNSEELKKALAQNGILNVEALHIGLKIPSSEPEYENLDSKSILLAGRLNESKGIYALLDAFGLIKNKIPDAKIILVGADEDEQKRIKQYLAQNNIGENDVKIIGWTEKEMDHFYKSAALVATPSLIFDTLLRINLEAALYKKPAVTTCFGGAKEFVIDGQTGYVVNPFDKKELAEKICDLLNNPDKRRQFGEAAFRRLKEHFSLDKQVNEILGWYKKILNEKFGQIRF